MVDRSADPPAEINHSWKRAWVAWVIAERCAYAVLVAYNSTITGAWSRANEVTDIAREARNIGFSPLGARDTDACTRIANQFFGPFDHIVIVTNEAEHPIRGADGAHFHRIPEPVEIQ
jgi:hypothetical protein